MNLDDLLKAVATFAREQLNAKAVSVTIRFETGDSCKLPVVEDDEEDDTNAAD